MIHLKDFINNIHYNQLLHITHRNYAREVLPSSTRKIFQPNPNKKRYEIKKASPPPLTTSEGPRINELGIQMLSKAIYDQIYKDKEINGSVPPDLVQECLKNLEKHGMKSKDSSLLPDVDFALPELMGHNICDHFRNIGENQAKPYRELILSLLEGIPAAPTKWVMQEGWTKYSFGAEPVKVDFPSEEALIFDVEVCMSAGKPATLATAVSSTSWYGWVSQSLIDGVSKPVTTHQYPEDSLIPLESCKSDRAGKMSDFMRKPKILVGHNVSFDRARIKEQYWLNRTGTRFLDTMSLHICVSGLTSYQRAVIKSNKFVEEDESWLKCSSLNSLVDVYNLYCNKKLEKQTRDLFIDGSLSEIRDNFQKVMEYCSGDVWATFEVLQVLFPLFLDRFQHPVTLAGMLELSTAYLPINDNWNRYIEESEQCFDDLENEGRILLAKRADQACQLLHDRKYEQDLWMWDQDWTVKEIKMKAVPKSSKKSDIETCENQTQLDSAENNLNSENDSEEEPDPLEEKFRGLWRTKNLLPKVRTLLPGYPNWYRKLCSKPDTPDWVPGPYLISTSMQITPKLLSLTWEGYPLHYIREKGWGFLVPFNDDLDIKRKLPLKELLQKCPLLTGKPTKVESNDALTEISKNVQDHLARKDYYSRLKKDKTGGLYKGAGVWCDVEVEDCCYFFKLPHKDGGSNNVGNPLAKDFLNKFSENVLAGDTESAEQVLAIARKLSYWRNNRDRILDQMVIWLERRNLPSHLDGNFGAIIPQVVVCGTLTRRAVEPTWMTASNAHPERIGSELRAMIQAPPGFNIVGADVDSQELWIASILGDTYRAKMHGATPFGWMTLSGSKADGTDMHSVTAKAVGISRDHAKVINYARIYGAGQNFAERLLKQFNPTLSDSEARSKAVKMFQLTKGKRIYVLKDEFKSDFPDEPYSIWQAYEIAKACGKAVDKVFNKAKWVGGTESAMFNRLEQIANNESPKTPFLEGRLSRALEPQLNPDSDKYLPTRVNWVVQSGAVDFLHLMLVSMKWIMGDKIRFCLSFHDEVRYLVPETYKYQAALAMHVTNLLTRAFCAYKVGLKDLPQSVAFFSSVEVDTVLRKEANKDCMTPSNPHGLERGYGVKNGESLDIYEAIKRAKGQNKDWYKTILSSRKQNAEDAAQKNRPPANDE